MYKNVEYESYKKLAEAFNMTKKTLHYRLRSGLTLEQAIETPVTYSNNFLNPDSVIKKQAKALNISDEDKKILRKTWADFNRRCSNPFYKSYSRYGGRGISVYPDWVKTEDNPDAFSKFLLWVMSPDGIGTRPKVTHPSGFTLYSIDRINNNGNYEPGNLRWATNKQQNDNRSVSYTVQYKGVSYNNRADLARAFNVRKDTLRDRLIKYNWPLEKAVETSVSPRLTYLIDEHTFTNSRALTRFYGIHKLVEKIGVKNEDVVEFVLKHREDNPDLFVANGISFKTKRMQRQLHQGSASLYVYVGKGDDYELLAKPNIGAVDKVVNGIVRYDIELTSKLKTKLIESKQFLYGVAEAIVVETADITYYLVAHFDIKK